MFRQRVKVIQGGEARSAYLTLGRFHYAVSLIRFPKYDVFDARFDESFRPRSLPYSVFETCFHYRWNRGEWRILFRGIL